MTLIISIEVGNDAFYPNPEAEAARILQALALQLVGGYPVPGDAIKLRDINGNKVGTCEVLS